MLRRAMLKLLGSLPIFGVAFRDEEEDVLLHEDDYIQLKIDSPAVAPGVWNDPETQDFWSPMLYDYDNEGWICSDDSS